MSAEANALPKMSDVPTFDGSKPEECHAFIAAVLQTMLGQGKTENDTYVAHFVASKLSGDALWWLLGLDDEVQDSWNLLKRALLQEYGAHRLEGSVAKTSILTVPAAAPSMSFNSYDVEGPDEALPLSSILHVPAGVPPIQDPQVENTVGSQFSHGAGISAPTETRIAKHISSGSNQSPLRVRLKLVFKQDKFWLARKTLYPSGILPATRSSRNAQDFIVENYPEEPVLRLPDTKVPTYLAIVWWQSTLDPLQQNVAWFCQFINTLSSHNRNYYQGPCTTKAWETTPDGTIVPSMAGTLLAPVFHGSTPYLVRASVRPTDEATLVIEEVPTTNSTATKRFLGRVTNLIPRAPDLTML